MTTPAEGTPVRARIGGHLLGQLVDLSRQGGRDGDQRRGAGRAGTDDAGSGGELLGAQRRHDLLGRALQVALPAAAA